jgi:hypothetical protein
MESRCNRTVKYGTRTRLICGEIARWFITKSAGDFEPLCEECAAPFLSTLGMEINK